MQSSWNLYIVQGFIIFMRCFDDNQRERLMKKRFLKSTRYLVSQFSLIKVANRVEAC